MNIQTHEKYYLEIGEERHVLHEYSNVVQKVIFELESSGQGRIFLCADVGQRPFWQRFFFGSSRYTRAYFMCEWAGSVYALTFFDENDSEYNALTSQNLESINIGDGQNVTFGEPNPIKVSRCLSKDEAINTLNEFFKYGSLPKLLRYDFVE